MADRIVKSVVLHAPAHSVWPALTDAKAQEPYKGMPIARWTIRTSRRRLGEANGSRAQLRGKALKP
jgi:uncharacterized protein YndB with AHSA1/START domain